jgi:hypothetical protein
MYVRPRCAGVRRDWFRLDFFSKFGELVSRDSLRTQLGTLSSILIIGM